MNIMYSLRRRRNIKCLFGYHDWEFGYHHGMPFGISTEAALGMIKEGKTYPVDVCKRRDCSNQSRVIDGRRVMLKRGETEAP